jgi:hypothetical protein
MKRKYIIKYENRLICFVDVLGYSKLIQDNGIDYVYGRYSKFVDEVKSKTFYRKTTHQNKEKQTFVIAEIVSDSMLFISNEIDDVFSVNNFIGAIHNLLELGLSNNFLFRGAITVGDIIYDKERNIFLSKEFNSLAKFEPKMEIPTCVIFNEAKDIIIESMYGISAMKDGIVPSGDLPIIKYDIPLKEGITQNMWCLNYTFFVNNKVLQNANNFLIEPKKTNFMQYLEYIQQIPYELQVLGEEFLPAKYLRTMKSRSGMRISFLDENMNACEPNNNNISFTMIGRWKE